MQYCFASISFLFHPQNKKNLISFSCIVLIVFIYQFNCECGRILIASECENAISHICHSRVGFSLAPHLCLFLSLYLFSYPLLNAQFPFYWKLNEIIEIVDRQGDKERNALLQTLNQIWTLFQFFQCWYIKSFAAVYAHKHTRRHYNIFSNSFSLPLFAAFYPYSAEK